MQNGSIEVVLARLSLASIGYITICYKITWNWTTPGTERPHSKTFNCRLLLLLLLAIPGDNANANLGALHHDSELNLTNGT